MSKFSSKINDMNERRWRRFFHVNDERQRFSLVTWDEFVNCVTRIVWEVLFFNLKWNMLNGNRTLLNKKFIMTQLTKLLISKNNTWLSGKAVIPQMRENNIEIKIIKFELVLLSLHCLITFEVAAVKHSKQKHLFTTLNRCTSTISILTQSTRHHMYDDDEALCSPHNRKNVFF